MSNLKYKHTAYTSAQWASLNPVIVENEIVIESDTKRTKIGNGISTYNELEYADANSVGNSLGSIKPTDAAPTPARNGNYTFSIGGAKPAWLTAEAGVTTVKAGDGVAVVYSAPSSYSYTHIKIDRIADIYNVTVEIPLSAGQYYTPTTARAAVPAINRAKGKELTYETSAGVWVNEKFVGSDVANWTVEANWENKVTKYINNVSNLIYELRKNKALTYDPSTLKLKVIGSDAVQPSDMEIFTVLVDGIRYTINGAANSEQEVSVGAGASQLCILKSTANISYSLSDILVFNDSTDRSSTHIKLAIIKFNDGITSRVILDYRQHVPFLRKDINPIYNYAIRYRKNKYLTYDPSTLKLKVVGYDTLQPTDEEIFTLIYDGINYTFNGFVNAEQAIAVGASTSQLYILKSTVNKTVLLSDILVFNDSTDRSSTHIKLAHVTYNDGITSRVIQDYRQLYPNIRNKIESFEASFVFNKHIISRKQKWLSYDRISKKLIVVGSDVVQPTDFEIFTITHNGVRYTINGAVGSEILTSIGTGNAQIYIDISSVNVAVALSDFHIYNDATDRSATMIKLAHITYNDGFTSNCIIDYQDYVNKQRAFSPLVLSASFINNSIGETNFANGVQTKLKILGFGNSFMRNSVWYLSKIAASGIGVNLTIGNLYTGGTNLDDHLSALNSGSNPYLYAKHENGVHTVNLTNQTAASGLLDERWDAVILHQYTPWTEPFQPTLNLLLAKIVEVLGYCPKFYLNATWAGHQDYVLAQYGFATESEMWQYMIEKTQLAATDSGIILNSVIPTGTAIQNARTLAYAGSYNRFTNGGTDWHHLNPAGGFIAACAIYEKIIYPLNKIHCSNTTFRINAATSLPPETITQDGILVTDDNYLSMCQSVIDAVENPDTITNQL